MLHPHTIWTPASYGTLTTDFRCFRIPDLLLREITFSTIQKLHLTMINPPFLSATWFFSHNGSSIACVQPYCFTTSFPRSLFPHPPPPPPEQEERGDPWNDEGSTNQKQIYHAPQIFPECLSFRKWQVHSILIYFYCAFQLKQLEKRQMLIE